MSRSVFEYYFDADDLAPFYSDLANADDFPGVRAVNRNRKNGANANVQVAVFADRVHENLSNTIGHDDCEKSIAPHKEVGPVSQSQSTESKKKTCENINKRHECSFEFETDRSQVRNFLSVHSLGQFVFCHRAGVLATESACEDEADEPMPRLTFLPNFDREKIEEMLSAEIKKVLMALLYILAMAMFIVVGILEQNRILVLPLVILFVASIVWITNEVIIVFRLITRRRSAINAEARSPNPEITEIQQVNWWSMLNAGFEPVNYQRPFRHPELPLEGCPWRVLERDSIRIPVIRTGGNRLGNRKGDLFSKHHVRLVAYAVLLESVGHVEVPYGLVFPHDSPRGMAVPITNDVREKVTQTLAEFATAITGSQQNQLQPALPENRNQCGNCVFGKPEAISVKEIESRRKSGSKLVILHNNSGDTFHCQCSDRFGTVPPHSETGRRRLVAAIE